MYQLYLWQCFSEFIIIIFYDLAAKMTNYKEKININMSSFYRNGTYYNAVHSVA